MKIDRSKMHKSLANRVDESAKTFQNSRSNYVPYYRTDIRTPFIKKFPENTPIIIDIIPFICTENFLLNDNMRPAYIKGEFYYNLDLFVHMNMGPSKTSILCPKKHLGKPCRICEIAEERKEDCEYGDKEKFKKVVKPFLPQHRTMYNIWWHDRPKEEEKKGVQILEFAHFSLEEQLLAISEQYDEDEQTTTRIQFHYPGLEGRKIYFVRKGTGMNTQYQGYKFMDRKEEIPDEILEQAFPLNELPKILSYKEINAIINASDEEEDDSSKEDNEDNDESKEEKPTKQSLRGTRQPAKKSKCPFKHKFGEDHDQTEDCTACEDDVFSECRDAS